MAKWMTTTYGSGEKVKVIVTANSREEALEQAPSFPWHVTKVTARKARLGEKDDRAELKWRV